MEICPRKSVGGVLERNGKIYMIDRRFEPLGWACPAGHLDEGKTPEEMIRIEYEEEIALHTSPERLLVEEMVPWNNCRRSNNEGHYWYVFSIKDSQEEPVPDSHEAKSGGWFGREEIANLNLEPVWRYWFEKLGYIKPLK